MTAELVVPPAIEAVIAKFEAASAPFGEQEVQQALGTARSALINQTDAENLGAWAELLAFALRDNGTNSSSRKTYFSLVSADPKDDATVYSPDIAGAETEILSHWTQRAKTLKHPVLKARYADLAWDMSRAIANARPDPEMARTAIDAYLASLAGTCHADAHDRFHVAIRALGLAAMIHDAAKVDVARNALLKLHREAMAADQGLWWMAIDRLLDDKNVGVTDAERDQLVADLESIVAKRSNTSDPIVFDPHAAESAAKKLIKHYNKRGQGDDARRNQEIIARTFEHFASLGNAMLASSVLQTAVNAYRDAGLQQESKRARIAMEGKIAQSHDEAGTFTFEQTISREDMDKFLGEIVVPDLGGTFAQIAGAFLQSRSGLEKRVAALQQQSPLVAAIGQTIVADNHVAAKVGSVEDDPFGRLIRQAQQEMSLGDMWLVNALRRTIEVHGAMPAHFAGWVARSGVFADLTLLVEGVAAWYGQDFVKAVHVLVPQVEKGLRGIVSKLGKPVTKRHPTNSGVSVVIGMGELLYSKEIQEALGPELTLHFLSLYSDPRGFNLRNKVAHGMIDADEIDPGLASRIIHTLLVFGIWEPLSKVGKDKQDPKPDTAAAAS